MQGLKFTHSTVNPDAPVAFCSFAAMHTKMEILFVESDRVKAESLSRKSQSAVTALERSLSRHIPGTDLFKLNRSREVTGVDDTLYFALELCERMRCATQGYFDIAALSPSRFRPAYVTEPSTHSVRREDGEITLDLGGFAKGFALEKLREVFTEEGITAALFNFGDSSVLGIGHHPFGEYWSISPAKGCGEFRLNDSALSISGRARGGRDHIIDPTTGQFASKARSVAVSGRSALVCEILSTALYAAPAEKWKEILSSFKDYETRELNQ